MGNEQFNQPQCPGKGIQYAKYREKRLREKQKMRNKKFYPSYIPGKWIHYTNHKKKRIRKKYQNRIRRAARGHARDLETTAFLLSDASMRYGLPVGALAYEFAVQTTPQLTIPPISFPQLDLPPVEVPPIEVPQIPAEDLERLREAFQQIKDAFIEALTPLMEWLKKALDKFFKWLRDLPDHWLCENKRWWYMAEHHKKRRIRKKYRNRIKKEANKRAGELVRLLTEPDAEQPEEDETGSSNDDEEGP